MFTSEQEYQDFQSKLKNFKSHAELCLYQYAQARLAGLKPLAELENTLQLQDRYSDETPVEQEILQVENVGACSYKSADTKTVHFTGKIPACRRGCCGSTHISISMPVQCIWDPDNIEKIATEELQEMRKALEDQVAKRKEEERLEAEAQAKQQDIYDREEFERLKTKFTQ